MEQFKIPYPSSKQLRSLWNKQFGMNAYYAGKNWRTRKKDAEYWHQMVWAYMYSQNVRKEPFQNPVEVRFFWNDNLDIDNHAAMGKMIVDAMRGRVIINDNRKYLVGITHRFHDEDFILVQIEEV